MDRSETLVLKAEEAIKNGKPMQAAEYLEDILHSDPHNDVAWVMAAKLFTEPEIRRKYAQDALKVNPNNQDAKHIIRLLELETKESKRQTLIGRYLILFVLICLSIAPVISFPMFSSRFITQEPSSITSDSISELVKVSRFSLDRHNSDSLGTGYQSKIRSAPSVTPNGSFVTYKNGATIHLHDLSEGQNRSSSIIPEGNGTASSPILSANGRFIVFESNSKTLIPNEDTFGKNLFLYDYFRDEFTLITRSENGEPLNASENTEFAPSFSNDGEIVVFQSADRNIAPDDENGYSDIFVFNRSTQRTHRITVNNANVEANGASFNPHISADGQFVVYASFATNLSEQDETIFSQIFIHDLITFKTEQLTNSENHADKPQISQNGDLIAYLTTVTDDSYTANQNSLGLVILNRMTAEESILFADLGSSFELHQPTIENTSFDLTDNGRYVILGQSANYRINRDEGTQIKNFFQYDLEMNSLDVFNVREDGGLGPIYEPFVTEDGRSIVFLVEKNDFAERRNSLNTYLYKR